MSSLYEPAAYDEAVHDDGRPRAIYAPLLDSLTGTDLERLAADCAAHVHRAGATFASEGEEHPFRLDAVPRLISGGEWAHLASGLEQRARALERFVADAYGPRSIVAAGRLPERVIESAALYEPGLHGVEQPGARALVCGFDLVCEAPSAFRVLEDNARAPSGLVYATVARAALDRALPFAPPPRADPSGFYPQLRLAVESLSADGLEGAVVLTEGPSSAAWFEHRALAGALEVPLVEPRDLSLSAGTLHARLDERRREVRVLFRRVDEERLTDERGRPTWLAELLLEPVRKGRLTVVNPLGSGVADDKLAHAYVEEMIRFYLKEEPLIPSVRTLDLQDPESRTEALARVDELVVKPRAGEGGEGVIIGPRADRAALEHARELIAGAPADHVAQELVLLSTHPTLRDGSLAPRHIDLRAFAIGPRAAPTAITRFALEEGELVVNSSKGGGAKDTWILDGAGAGTSASRLGARAPIAQLDRATPS